MAPRLFWRRLAAVVVDVLLASLAGFLILWPFTGDTDRLRLSGPFYALQCGPVTSITEEAAAVIAPDLPAAALVCQQHVFGIDNGLTLRLLYAVETTGAVQASRNVSFAIDAEGKPVQPLQPQNLLVALLLIGAGGWMLSRRRLTPGKWLAGLRIGAEGGSAYFREALRLLPFLLWSGALALFALLDPKALNSLAQLPLPVFLGTIGLASLLTLAWYLIPVIRWRGVMPWDRWTGRGPVTRA
jgi:hypothetical protein